NEALVQDVAIRALERKHEMPNGFILDHILGELGLFPYVDKSNSTSKDKFRRSLFTTPHDESKTFHIRQAEVFHRIMNGENVILSAPTSFGKSLIIEALVASNEFNNIVIVVPTIALIDELKKKLFKYKDKYKIVTQVSQEPSDRNIFILTQERVLEYSRIESVDFFIIDEFYKLAPVGKNDERCDRLNLAFRALHAKCKRFYMLGPKINGLVSGIEEELRCTFLKFDSYATVATNEFYHPLKTTGKDALVDIERDEILKSILTSIGRKEQTVIYCKSPQRVSSLMCRLLSAGLLTPDDTNDDLAEWLADNFHNEWSLVEGVKHGIAYHHAQLPRAVGALIVDLFNESKINILICTSTLIEGVNTNAKNIVIYDDCITKKTKLDMFTFNNISGRSGRMFEHFVGNVYIFGDKPQVELPFIDVPVVTQSENASESLLLHLGEDVHEENKNRVKKFYDQN
ncbi:DEAD/DEAH box helicase, partial [Vibrio harveyi]|nr:DEAD/DEAH box helicase [Vibrio harveyi]